MKRIDVWINGVFIGTADGYEDASRMIMPYTGAHYMQARMFKGQTVTIELEEQE